MNEKILLVDDEENNLRLLTKWLIPLGYEVDLAANGDEAVRKVRGNRPDLIILDIMMPIMDGYQACRIIKEDPDTKSIPVIMVTALHERDSRLKGLSATGSSRNQTIPVSRLLPLSPLLITNDGTAGGTRESSKEMKPPLRAGSSRAC